MEVTVEILYLVAIVAVIFRIWAQAGYGLVPFYKDGKFQLNVIGIIITGFATAVPVVQSIVIVPDPWVSISTTFFTVAGVPTFIDKVVTKVTPTPEVVEEGV